MPLFAAISAAALRPITPDFGPQALANTAWALATMRYFYNPLLHAIAAAARPRISAFKSQDLSNSAWAFAILQLQDVPLMQAISAASIPRLT